MANCTFDKSKLEAEPRKRDRREDIFSRGGDLSLCIVCVLRSTKSALDRAGIRRDEKENILWTFKQESKSDFPICKTLQPLPIIVYQSWASLCARVSGETSLSLPTPSSSVSTTVYTNACEGKLDPAGNTIQQQKMWHFANLRPAKKLSVTECVLRTQWVYDVFSGWKLDSDFDNLS